MNSREAWWYMLIIPVLGKLTRKISSFWETWLHSKIGKRKKKAGVLGLLVKYLPHKHGELNLVPQDPREKPDTVVRTWNPAPGRQRISGAAAQLIWSSWWAGSQEKTLELSNWGRLLMLTLGLHMHEMYMCVYTHMHTYEHMQTHTKEGCRNVGRTLASTHGVLSEFSTSTA